MADAFAPEAFEKDPVMVIVPVTSTLDRSRIWSLAIWHSALVVLTLGIYRFWQTTKIRQSLWGSTRLGGSAFEYTGTAVQLLVGFLIFLVILLPAYGLSTLGALQLGTVSIVASVAFVPVMIFLFNMALFRARRYRLSRTVWRGIRFSQGGNSVVYGLRALAWTLAIILTLGLAYPWAAADLERAKANGTRFGDRLCTSTARGTALLGRFIVIWALVMLPLVMGLAAAISSGRLSQAALQSFSDPAWGDLSTAAGAVSLLSSLWAPWVVFVLLALWPWFKALEFRTFVGALRCGETALSSTLTAGSLYRRYLIFAGALVVFGLVGALIGVAIPVLAYTTLSGIEKILSRVEDEAYFETVFAGIALALYLVGLVFFNGIYIRYLSAPLFVLKAASIRIERLDALDDVVARKDSASGFGDDFASNFDFGGI